MDAQRFLVSFNRSLIITARGKIKSQRTQNRRGVGLQFERAFVLLQRRKRLALCLEAQAQIVECHGVDGGNFKRVREQRHAVLPITKLGFGDREQKEENCRANTDQHWPQPRCSRQKLAAAPRNNDENSDGWQISITIGQRLFSYLNQADHRNQSSQKPKQTREKPWLVP